MRTGGVRLPVPTAWPTRAGLLLWLALVGAPTMVGAPAVGTIHGRVEIGQSLPPPERRPTVTELGMPAPRVLPDRRRSVVYLETAPLGAFEQPAPRRAVMDQRNESFVPHVLAVTAGTVVDFLNSDPTYHNVFSLSRTKSFDLGRYPTGQSKPVRFDRPGIVRVFCDIHSHMSAYILVFGHRFFALTDESGRFRIDGVPPGVYHVRVWHEALPGEVRVVRIPEGGGDVEVDFTLGRATALGARR
jgi:plastocyanin